MERQQAATLRAKEALAAEEQKCKELQAQLDAQARPADRKGQKTALEKEKQALAAEKQALEERDAALRAAMKEFDAKVEALAAVETAMKEKGRDGGGGGSVPEEHKNVAAEVKQFDTTATIRKQIDEQQAVLTRLFHIFEDVDVENCKFKITQVARNLLALEGEVNSKTTSNFANTIRHRLPRDIKSEAGPSLIKAATFNDIICAAIGCASVPTFNNMMSQLRMMGIAADRISHAAVGQHARKLEADAPITYCAIRGLPHTSRSRVSRICGEVLLDGLTQCPKQAKRGSVLCSRHAKRQRNEK